MMRIVYDDRDIKVYYSVERGDFGALGDSTQFAKARDAKMVKLALHEEQGISLLKLRVEVQ